MRVMNCYTIFDRPDDHPGYFVVRRFIIEPGATRPTPDFWLALTLEDARRLVPDDVGLACFPRADGDPPAVVETWL